MKIIFTILLLISSICNIYSQILSPQVVSSAGQTFTNNSMQLDWTLGELAITTIQAPPILVTQGMHQPYYTITRLNELPIEIKEIKIFPNPTANVLEINLKFDQSRKVLIQLIDLNGTLVWESENKNSHIVQKTQIDHLPNGTYFLSFLIDRKFHSKTYKIIKLD